MASVASVMAPLFAAARISKRSSRHHLQLGRTSSDQLGPTRTRAGGLRDRVIGFHSPQPIPANLLFPKGPREDGRDEHATLPKEVATPEAHFFINQNHDQSRRSGTEGRPRPRPSPSTGNNLLKLLAVILLVPALMPFFVPPVADMYNHPVFHSLGQSISAGRNVKRLRRQGDVAEQPGANGSRKIEPVVCGEYSVG
ncbi:hypothetical protein THAOC_00224 [Thalassiosira oceanica]|uniref:Uncharacterized protein n=1 Tax=Thalassiosira oceanica TaxID=159749 RepID=K0TPG1_THAOC|nr:hypothetical protein THAOC_00224 [Thalassiosira oceanica]|eukprot:EJK77911.1 hypothetical protein THAOC_00224 [Thalassiosira oceanica]